MNREEISDKLITMIGEQFGLVKEEIKEEVNFQTDLNADSLDAVEIIMETEDLFNLKIPDEAAEALLTVKSLIDYIEKNM